MSPAAIAAARKEQSSHQTPPRFFRCLFQDAFSLRLIDAKRIQLRHLVQETLLRRGRDDGFGIAEEDRLPELPVPFAEGQLLALEGGDREIVGADEGLDLLRLGALRPAWPRRRRCAPRSMPPCPSKACGGRSPWRSGSGSGCRPTARWPDARPTASVRPCRPPAAESSCGRGRRCRTPRSRRPPAPRHGRASPA